MQYFTKHKKEQGVEDILKTARAIVLTPISKDPLKDSYIDYVREMDSSAFGNYNVMWDDSPSNNARIGDLFSFVTGQSERQTSGFGYCQIRRIIGLCDNTHRPSFWTIPHHVGRKVLILSDILCEGTWQELSKLLGEKPNGKPGLNPMLNSTRFKIIT